MPFVILLFISLKGMEAETRGSLETAAITGFFVNLSCRYACHSVPTAIVSRMEWGEKPTGREPNGSCYRCPWSVVGLCPAPCVAPLTGLLHLLPSYRLVRRSRAPTGRNETGYDGNRRWRCEGRRDGDTRRP